VLDSSRALMRACVPNGALESVKLQTLFTVLRAFCSLRRVVSNGLLRVIPAGWIRR
jgi:hypothetical protein